MVVWEGSSDLDLASLRHACRLGLLYPFLEGAVLHCGQRALRPCLPHLRPHTSPKMQHMAPRCACRLDLLHAFYLAAIALNCGAACVAPLPPLPQPTTARPRHRLIRCACCPASCLPLLRCVWSAACSAWSQY